MINRPPVVVLKTPHASIINAIVSGPAEGLLPAKVMIWTNATR